MDDKQKEQMLLIAERYRNFVEYIYPALLNINNKHRDLKTYVINLVLTQRELLYKAIKTTQKSKMYEADAGLAAIRAQIRFLSDSNRKLLSKRKARSATITLSETGKMLNEWIAKVK